MAKMMATSHKWPTQNVAITEIMFFRKLPTATIAIPAIQMIKPVRMMPMIPKTTREAFLPSRLKNHFTFWSHWLIFRLGVLLVSSMVPFSMLLFISISSISFVHNVQVTVIIAFLTVLVNFMYFLLDKIQ